MAQFPVWGETLTQIARAGREPLAKQAVYA
jgi:hypothetical protein